MSTQENLEERIERIRKRNEELQKKHAEAEADKQRAKKENAMVQTKSANYDDWPREHKYDNMEFTFDNNYEINNVISDEVRDKKKEKHNKSQFAEGDGPPPDPSYSFLKDADRDYNHIEQIRNKNNSTEKAQWTNQRNQQRGGMQGRGGFRGNVRGAHKRGDFLHNNGSQPAYDAWRCERNKIDEARINRQRNSEGKWRREWDVEKIDNDIPNEICHTRKPDKFTVGDVLLTKKPNATDVDKVDKNKEFNRARPNITVSLSRSGEVQSVKVSSPPAIGSGRVGPRQIKSRHSFNSDSFDGKDARKNFLQDRDVSPNKKIDKNKLPNKQQDSNMQQQSNSGNSVQNRLHKFKNPKDFSKLSKELKCVSKEIEGLCTSVENLNKKHTDVFQNDIDMEAFEDNVAINNLLLNNKNEEVPDEFCLSTDLITGSDDLDNFDTLNVSLNSFEINLKSDFGNMGTADIENFIEQEVERNKISFSDTDIKETLNNSEILEHFVEDINSDIVKNTKDLLSDTKAVLEDKKDVLLSGKNELDKNLIIGHSIELNSELQGTIQEQSLDVEKQTENINNDKNNKETNENDPNKIDSFIEDISGIDKDNIKADFNEKEDDNKKNIFNLDNDNLQSKIDISNQLIENDPKQI